MDFKIEELSVWDKLQSTSEPIIMYGTGNGADKVLDALEKLNVKISGVTASSGFVRERFFRGFRVMPLSHFEQEYESFTVIITFGSSVPEVMENIYSIAKSHRTLIPVVPVIGTELFDRAFLNANSEKINSAYGLMADETSKKVFAGYVNFLYGGEPEVLKGITSDEDEAFGNILTLNDKETYVDIGAYRGDTVEKFLSYTNNSYAKIICAEPDTKSYSKLLLNCAQLENFEAHNVAVADIDGEIGFSDLHGRQSAIGGNKLTSCMTLTSLCKNASPTYIKIDAEGYEAEILNAGKDILKKYSPKLNVAAYHKCSDIFTIPLLLKSINPQYKIHLRHHPYIPAWDTNFYVT